MSNNKNVLYDGDGNETELPTVWKVCARCHGEGKHVNPSIDGNGITAEEFAEDPDFREEYFAGAYDVKCYECAGKRVVKVVDEEKLTEEQRRAWYEQEEDRALTDSIYRAERRMGA